MGMYEDALHHYQQAELDTLTEKPLPCRSLRIIAESYAIKGLQLTTIYFYLLTIVVCFSAIFLKRYT